MLPGMRNLAVVIALCASTVAHAETRAWTAAKKVLPAGLEFVAGVNVSTIRSTQLFAGLWPLLAQKSKDTAMLFDKIKSTCGIDALAQIDSFVIGGSLDDSDASVFVLSLKSSEKDIEQCITKVDKALGKTMTIGKDGPYVTYNEGNGEAYAKWLDSKTIAITLKSSDKDFLGKMTAGGIAKDRGLAGAKTDAAVWFVYDKAADLDQLQAKMSRAYGSADVKAGTVAVNAHLVLPDAATAKSVAAKTSEQLDTLKKSNAVPADFAWLVKSLAFAAQGSELVATASGSESDVVTLVKTSAQ